MPLVLIIFAAAAIVIGARGQANAAGSLIVGEITGSDGKEGFAPWVLAVLIIGVLGYIKNVKVFSDAFIALIILAIFLKDGQGFFANLQSALSSAKAAPANPVAPVATASPSPSTATGQPAAGPSNGAPATPQAGAPTATGSFLPGGTIAVPGFNGVGVLNNSGSLSLGSGSQGAGGGYTGDLVPADLQGLV